MILELLRRPSRDRVSGRSTEVLPSLHESHPQLAWLRAMVHRGVGKQINIDNKTPVEILSDGLLLDDFPQTLHAFQHYGIKIDGMPTQEDLQRRFQRVEEDALKLNGARLLLIPPLTLQQLIKAINNHPVRQQKGQVLFYDRAGGNYPWSGGRPENIRGWEVKIAEGIHNPDIDPIMNLRHVDDHEKVRRCLEGFVNKGVDVMNDARLFLVLAMLTLAGNDRGELLDTRGHTLLNAKNLTSTGQMMTGSSENDRLNLFMHSNIRNVHLRGVVDVPEDTSDLLP